MACGLILIPLSIGIITTVDEHYKLKEMLSKGESLMMATRFNDSELLLKTLKDYGLTPKKTTSNCFAVKFADGDIIYNRPSANETFSMTVRNIRDKEKLIKDLFDIEQEYNGNVQEYTYQRVLNNLPEGMAIENEEVLEDDSILITLSVE
jgi:hypothetical protein